MCLKWDIKSKRVVGQVIVVYIIFLLVYKLTELGIVIQSSQMVF